MGTRDFPVTDDERRRIEAAERERCAKIAMSFEGTDRFQVHDEWASMTPSEVYNIGITDAAAWIAQEISKQQ